MFVENLNVAFTSLFQATQVDELDRPCDFIPNYVTAAR